MAYLSILRTSQERCEQCDSTEHVLQFVMSQDDEDTVRLIACLICVVVAMDNAMEWNMTRSFAQALANRAAGEQVQEARKREMEVLSARISETTARTRIPSDAGGERGRDTHLLSLRNPDAGTSESPAQDTRSSDRASGNEADNRKTKKRRS